MMSESGSFRVVIVGAGSVGRVLGRRLVERGQRVLSVVSRSEESARRLASELGIEHGSNDVGSIPVEVNVVLVCVPDSSIGEVAEELADLQRDWKQTIVAHTSGLFPASALSAVAERGATVLSFHPLQAITPESSPSILNDAYAGLEGDVQAVEAGEKLAAAFGMKPVVIPTGAKPRYHLAAVMGSNLLVVLIKMAEDVLQSIGAEEEDSSAWLRPLVRGTISNLETSPADEALTGPVVRGDLATLEEHAKTLETHFPHLIPAYVALSTEAASLAVRSGRLWPEKAGEVVAFLERIGS